MELVGQVRITIPVTTPAYAGPTGPSGDAIGFNGDAVHADASGMPYAYVGSWGRRRPSNETTFCPGSAIKVVNLSDPANPVQVAVAAAHGSSTSEDVEVRTVNTTLGTIDLLATGLQRCQNAGMAGADFWDVSDPTNPVHLGFYDVSSPKPGDPVCLDSEGNPAVPTVGFDLEAARFGASGFGPGEEGNTHSAEPAVIGGVPLVLTYVMKQK